jgi:hypothetical protein
MSRSHSNPSKKKLKEVELTYQEWLLALRMPTPVKNKKKYNRRKKHPKKDLED